MCKPWEVFKAQTQHIGAARSTPCFPGLRDNNDYKKSYPECEDSEKVRERVVYKFRKDFHKWKETGKEMAARGNYTKHLRWDLMTYHETGRLPSMTLLHLSFWTNNFSAYFNVICVGARDPRTSLFSSLDRASPTVSFWGPFWRPSGMAGMQLIIPPLYLRHL